MLVYPLLSNCTPIWNFVVFLFLGFGHKKINSNQDVAYPWYLASGQREIELESDQSRRRKTVVQLTQRSNNPKLNSRVNRLRGVGHDMRRMDANIYSTSKSRLELGLVMLWLNVYFFWRRMLPQDRTGIQGRWLFFIQWQWGIWKFYKGI